VDNYFLTVSQRSSARTWRWQIHRRIRPLGVKLYEDGFALETEARRAGEKALRELLADIVREKDDDA
jgi:hypothetical protein